MTDSGKREFRQHEKSISVSVQLQVIPDMFNPKITSKVYQVILNTQIGRPCRLYNLVHKTHYNLLTLYITT